MTNADLLAECTRLEPSFRLFEVTEDGDPLIVGEIAVTHTQWVADDDGNEEAVTVPSGTIRISMTNYDGAEARVLEECLTVIRRRIAEAVERFAKLWPAASEPASATESVH